VLAISKGEGRGYLFRNPGATNARGQWSESAMKPVWQAACTAAGVRVSLYAGTKHSMATVLTSAGVGDRVIATILGHSDERSVRKYARLQPEAIRSAMRRIPR
jgi:site-specific recombinase XerD